MKKILILAAILFVSAPSMAGEQVAHWKNPRYLTGTWKMERTYARKCCIEKAPLLQPGAPGEPPHSCPLVLCTAL
jgi:hypothetical protein